jgi:hypothetical protein
VKGEEIMDLLHLSPTAGRGTPRGNSAIDTTLYELIEAIMDTIEPGEDALIEATVQGLVESGKLSWIRRVRDGMATRHAAANLFSSLN